MKRPDKIQALVNPWVKYADELLDQLKGVEITNATRKTQLSEALAKIEKYESVLNALAQWNNKKAITHLRYTKSYEAFDEPRAARLAREALKEVT